MKQIAGVGEARLLDLIKPYVGAQAGADDSALFEPSGQFEVVSTDMAVEGVHFDLSWMTAEDAGWRALALALGDLAAKGATPRWALVSLAVPRGWELDDFVALFRGMHKLGSAVGVSIEGGDMSAIDGPAVLAMTVSGYTETRPIPRSAAQPAWSVGVTGPLGASAAALRERRVLRPLPLIETGLRLNRIGLCCGDISDGLIRELERFSEMAGVGFRLDATKVPVAPGATLDDALAGGEEVELVCVGPDATLREAGLEPVGSLTKVNQAVIDGIEDRPRGYDHFA